MNHKPVATPVILAALAGSCILSMLFFVQPVQAQLIVQASGNLTRIDPPPTIRRAAFQDDKNVTLVEEQQGLFLPKDVDVDFGAPGTFTALPEKQMYIPSNTEVDSTLAFVSPAGSDAATYDVSIRFASKILGVIVSKDLIQTSNGILGDSGTNYPSPYGYQEFNFDGTSDSDSIRISEDRQTVTLHLASRGELEMLRIITGWSGMPDLSRIHSKGAPSTVVTPMPGTRVTHNHNRGVYRVPQQSSPVYVIQ